MAHAGEFSSFTRHYGDRSPEPTNTSTWTVSTHKKSNQPLLPLTSTWRLSERKKLDFCNYVCVVPGLILFITPDVFAHRIDTLGRTTRLIRRPGSPRGLRTTLIHRDAMSDGENVHQHETSLRTANTQRHWSLICMRCTSFTRDSD